MLLRGPDPARRRALLALAVLALLGHAALLGGIELGGPRAGRGEASPVQVRMIVPPPSVPATVAPAPPPPPPPPAPRPRARPPPPPPPPVVAEPAAVEPPVPVPVAEAAASAASVEPAAPVVAEPASAVAVAAAASAASAPAPTALGEAPPLYRTLLPPAGTLRYELQRGRLTGSGELLWRPQGARYELSLDGSVIGLRVLTQVSQGGLAPEGLAPERFTDQRARRPMQAANFRRESGRIAFSAATQEFPLWPGVQDRLSWMLQLAAIVAAEPARWVAGERIVLQVVGARGDAGVWVFQVGATEEVDSPSGPVPALHLRREPRQPYDTGVEVWLDPARHHLPVRALQRSGEDERLELRLREWLPA